MTPLKCPFRNSLPTLFLDWPLNNLWFGGLSWFELDVTGYSFSDLHPSLNLLFWLFAWLLASSSNWPQFNLPLALFPCLTGCEGTEFFWGESSPAQFAWGKAGLMAGSRQVYCILQMCILTHCCLTLRGHCWDAFVNFYCKTFLLPMLNELFRK